MAKLMLVLMLICTTSHVYSSTSMGNQEDLAKMKSKTMKKNEKMKKVTSKNFRCEAGEVLADCVSRYKTKKKKQSGR